MVDNEIAQRAFKRKVSTGVKVEQDGLDRFVVYTPFAFDDGDGFVVVLKRDGDQWILTDEGHTFMHLSYKDVDLTSGTRAQVIDRALASSLVENLSGELRLTIPGKAYGDALFTFVQTLTRVASTADWTQERVRSTFCEDVSDLIESIVPMPRVQQKFVDREVDSNGTSPIDLMVEGHDRRWLIFAVANDVHCQQATIACLKYEQSKSARYSSVVIYENQLGINRRFLAQLSDVSGKSFSSLGERNRIAKYFAREVLGKNGEDQSSSNR